MWSILSLVAGVRRAHAQEILNMARVLEAHQMRGIPKRLARNIRDTIQETAGWVLDDRMFQKRRPLLAEEDEAVASPSDSGDDYEGPENPDEDPTCWALVFLNHLHPSVGENEKG